jgi:hypothetical protein
MTQIGKDVGLLLGGLQTHLFPAADFWTVGGDFGEARKRLTAAGLDLKQLFIGLDDAEDAYPAPVAPPIDPEDAARMRELRRAALHPAPPSIGNDMSRPVAGNEFHVTTTFRE